MKPMRHIEPELRRARLLAARGYKAGCMPWRGILGGHWDGGQVVQSFRNGKGSFLGRANYPSSNAQTKAE